MPACRYKKSKQFFSNQSDLPWPFSMLKEAHYIFFTFYDFMIGLIESIKFRVSCQLRLVLGRVIPKNRVSGSLGLKNQGKMKHSLQTMFNLGSTQYSRVFFRVPQKPNFRVTDPLLITLASFASAQNVRNLKAEIGRRRTSTDFDDSRRKMKDSKNGSWPKIVMFRSGIFFYEGEKWRPRYGGMV